VKTGNKKMQLYKAVQDIRKSTTPKSPHYITGSNSFLSNKLLYYSHKADVL